MSSGTIIVIGSGFAGFWAALAARRVAGDAAEILMIAPEPHLQMRPRLYEAAPETLGVDLLPLLDSVGVGFRAGEVVAIDADRRTVTLADGAELAFARLIVATGSRMRRPPVPGADLAWSIDTQPEAIAFDRRLADIVATARPARIAIVGAGFSGIELALELRDRLAAHGAGHLAEAARILLIDRADAVGAELGAGPRPVIEAALAAAGVELRLGASVAGLSATHVDFADGERLDADAVVLTTGMVASPLTALVPGTRDPIGRVLVDDHLRAPDAPAIFVTGDAAAALTGDGEGHRTLQSCQHALQLGRFAGENAARDLLGEPLIPYVQARYVTCLDLGRAGAVLTEGWDREVRMTGEEAGALKRRINQVVIYPPAGVLGETLLALSDTDPAKQMLPAPAAA